MYAQHAYTISVCLFILMILIRLVTDCILFFLNFVFKNILNSKKNLNLDLTV